MRGDSAISLTRMRSNGGQAAAKPRQKTRAFDRTSSKLNYLHVVVSQLKRLAAALRRTKGKLKTPYLAT
jgi:hypothetical protein